MREAGAPSSLVLGSDVIYELHVDDRRRVIFRQDDRQPVGQRGDFVLKLRRTGGRERWLGGRGEDPAGKQRRGQHTRAPGHMVRFYSSNGYGRGFQFRMTEIRRARSLAEQPEPDQTPSL